MGEEDSTPTPAKPFYKKIWFWANAVFVVAVIVVAAIVVGALGNDADDDGPAATATNEATAESGENAAAEVAAQAAAEAAAEAAAQAAAQAAEAASQVTVGQTVATENYEFTVKGIEFGSEARLDGQSSYYESDSGLIYVNVRVAYKNLTKQTVKDSDVCSTVMLLYGDGYEYPGRAEDSDRNGVAPLATSTLHLLAQVPPEVETSKEPLALKFTMYDTEYTYVIR